jgi:hypothetical protein
MKVTHAEPESNKLQITAVDKLPWEPIAFRFVARITDIVLGGKGKSGANSDSGDIFKPRGQG